METRRGWHIYTDMPEPAIGGQKIRALGEGIDVQGAGRMVVGPGSVVSGHHRTLTAGDLANVPPCPAWLVLILRAAEPQRQYTGQLDQPWHRWQAAFELEQRCQRVAQALPEQPQQPAQPRGLRAAPGRCRPWLRASGGRPVGGG